MSTGLDVFDNTVQKTNALLREIEEQMGWEDRRNQSYLALRVVLHQLRDRLTVQECGDMAAQLPLLVKGIFFDGWKPGAAPKKMDREEFLENVREQFFFSIEGSISNLVVVVLQALRRYVSGGEFRHVISVLPKDLADLLEQAQPATPGR